MVDTRQLDAKLRDKGRAQLRSEISEAALRLSQMISMCFNSSASSIPQGNSVLGMMYSARELLIEIEKVILRERSAVYEQKAVDAFMAQVEKLAEEVDELRSSIEG